MPKIKPMVISDRDIAILNTGKYKGMRIDNRSLIIDDKLSIPQVKIFYEKNKSKPRSL
jgi:hypothetical protein